MRNSCVKPNKNYYNRAVCLDNLPLEKYYFMKTATGIEK